MEIGIDSFATAIAPPGSGVDIQPSHLMGNLLRADWLRLRRRRDLWIIGIAVAVIGGLSFLASYRSDVADPVFPDAAQVREEIISFSDFPGPSGMGSL